MNYTKRIVCLASSKKHGGRCVAGKEMSDGHDHSWIRPVSARPSAEVLLDERRYENGQEPQILDVMDIPMLAPVPRVHQTENHMIDDQEYWVRRGALGWNDLAPLADSPQTLWTNSNDATYHGRYDRIIQATATAHHGSLYLIRPEQTTIRVLTPGAAFGNPKRCVRANFVYRDIRYDLTVTDPTVEASFLARPNGDYPVEQDVYFCVSLAEAHTDGYCYKLIATIISQQPL